MSLRGLVVLATFLLAALAPSVSAGVTVVDASSPTPVLQAAIDAAVNGDILLVLAGSSETGQAITINGKGLTLVAWPSGAHVAVGRMQVKNVPAGMQVVVRGFTIAPAQPYGFYFEFPYPSPAALELSDCAGSVWIEDCTATSPPGASGGGIGNHGASVQQCADVVIVRCTLTGGRGGAQGIGCGAPFAFPGQPGGSGLKARGSKVVLHGTLARGDRGGSQASGECPVPGDAGHGVLLENASHGLVAGCTVIGGDHLPGTGEPGMGLRVIDSASDVALRPGVQQAGAGVPGWPPVVAPVGSFTGYSQPPRQILCSSPIAEGGAASLAISGVQGDLTAVFISFKGSNLPVPFKEGTFSLAAPLGGPFILGTNPNPSGLWTIPFTAPPLSSPAMQGQSFLLQLVVHNGLMVTFEGTTTFALVDSTFP